MKMTDGMFVREAQKVHDEIYLEEEEEDFDWRKRIRSRYDRPPVARRRHRRG